MSGSTLSTSSEGWYDDSQLNRCCRRSLIQRHTHLLTLENLFEIDNS